MRTVAAFDFDGTLASGDAVIPFFAYVRGHRRVARTLVSMLPLVRFRDRDLLKETIVARLLTDRSDEEIRLAGKEFAQRLLEKKLHPQVVERLRHHQESGHETVVVSASLNVYLEPVAEDLGIDKLICTTLEIADGRATGRLLGRNVRAAEKARLLGELLASDDNVELWAYGNSSGDYDLLKSADHPFWVDRKGNVSEWKPTEG